MQAVEKSIIEVLTDIFKQGEKFTIFKISDSMAMTQKTEIQVVGYNAPGVLVFKIRGKRKLYTLQFETWHYQSAPLRPLTSAIFAGWDCPITCDTDAPADGAGIKKMRGNACFNFVGTAAAVREWIDTKQLNPFCEKTRVVAIEPVTENEIPVYAAEYRESGKFHAVIDRLVEGLRENTPISQVL